MPVWLLKRDTSFRWHRVQSDSAWLIMHAIKFTLIFSNKDLLSGVKMITASPGDRASIASLSTQKSDCSFAESDCGITGVCVYCRIDWIALESMYAIAER